MSYVIELATRILILGSAASVIAFLAREAERHAAAAEAVTEGLLLGNFEGDTYKTDKKNSPLEAGVLVGLLSG